MTEGKQRFFPALAQLLALEYHCSPEEIGRDNITLTTPILQPGQRQYSPKAPFFSMVSTGRGAVITAADCLHPFLREHTLFFDRERHRILLVQQQLRLSHRPCRQPVRRSNPAHPNL